MSGRSAQYRVVTLLVSHALMSPLKVVFAKLPAAQAAASIQSGPAQQAGTHINRVIKAHSETTVVTMMHLAKPPPGGAAVDECTEYLDNIAALTDSLPLTMLCGTGVGESVITTAI